MPASIPSIGNRLHLPKPVGTESPRVCNPNEAVYLDSGAHDSECTSLFVASLLPRLSLRVLKLFCSVRLHSFLHGRVVSTQCAFYHRVDFSRPLNSHPAGVALTSGLYKTSEANQISFADCSSGHPVRWAGPSVDLPKKDLEASRTVHGSET